MAKVLSPAAVEQVHKWRDEVDEWGEPRYSGAWIAGELGVSESTVWRVLKQRTAYGRVRRQGVMTEKLFGVMERDGLKMEGTERPDLVAAAEASQARFLAGLRAKREEIEHVTPALQEKAAMLGAGVRLPPMSLLDGGDVEDEAGGSGLQALVAAQKELK